MSTTVVYRDVILRDCETLAFEQDIRYDDSGTDALYSRFVIRVASTLVSMRSVTGAYQFGIDTPDGQTVAQRYHDIQARLSEPRGDFYFLQDNCIAREDHNSGTAILNQPLLIAVGKAYTEEIQQVQIGGAGGTTVDKLVRTELFMPPHPFSQNSDSTYYGPGDGLISKSLVLDCENGPKPKKVSVKKLIGGRAMRVEFEIEICRRLPPEDFQDSEPAIFGSDLMSDGRVLSNRWFLSEMKDENWVTERSLQGTLQVTHSDFWPHAMRYLCLPSLMRGYKRVRQSFVDDPTGLVLKYRIDDKQAQASPPYPAIAFRGHHAETGTGPNGIIRGSEFHIRLTGPIGVNKPALLQAARKVAINRIKGLVPPRDGNGKRTDYRIILKNVSVVDVIDQPVIELRVQVQHTDDEGSNSLGLRLDGMGDPLDELADNPANPDAFKVDGYDPQVWPVPLPYDSLTPAGLFSCYLQNPNSVWHDVPGGFVPQSQDFPVTVASDSDRPASSPSGLPDSATSSDTESLIYHPDHNIPTDTTDLATASELYDFPYSFIEISQRYEICNGWSQLPLANTAPDTDQTALLVKLHGRIAKRILTLVATRDGRPPKIPTMLEDQTDPNGHREVLSDISIENAAPTLSAQGNGRRYGVRLTYEYLLEKAPSETEKLRVGSLPLDKLAPEENWLDLAAVTDDDGDLQWKAAE